MSSKANPILKAVCAIFFTILFVLAILIAVLPLYSSGYSEEEFTSLYLINYLGTQADLVLVLLMCGTVLGSLVGAVVDNKLAGVIGIGASLASAVFYINVFSQILKAFNSGNENIIQNLLPGSFLLVIVAALSVLLGLISLIRLFLLKPKAKAEAK